MMTIASRSTTGIGSLPHHNIDAALEFSFRMGIPFLPQIPVRNPWEFMIAQALDGLPGLQVDEDGAVSLNYDIWNSRAHSLNQRLAEAFDNSAKEKEAFEAFEPTPSTSSCWQPFIWELQERGSKIAKIQLAGPMTSQWAIRIQERGETVTDPLSIDRHPELATQIYRLVMARAIAMARRLQANGIRPILYLDEPGLYGINPSTPKHLMGIQELKLMVQALRKEGILVGLHCCSNTDWSAVLNLGLNYLSIDTALSLEDVLKATSHVESFLQTGGRFSLGVIPTTRTSFGLHSVSVSTLFASIMDLLAKYLGKKPELASRVLSEAIYTPACGLALHSTSDAEFVIGVLTEFSDFCNTYLRDHPVGSA